MEQDELRTGLQVTCKVRYREEVFRALIKLLDAKELEDKMLKVEFEAPHRAVTPQQMIAFYNKEVCLGGAIIHSSGDSIFKKQNCEKYENIMSNI